MMLDARPHSYLVAGQPPANAVVLRGPTIHNWALSWRLVLSVHLVGIADRNAAQIAMNRR